MIKKLLEECQAHLQFFFDKVDSSQVENLVDLCKQCRGFLIFAGVGKSGIIAEKIAMTLVSTGTKALYLPPMNFLHGDIGIISSDDIVFLVSKSGETEELLNLVPFIQKRQAKTVALVSNPQSRLAKNSDVSIHLPVQKEMCSFDLVPTTSTQIQLILGDILAIALMKSRDFNMGDYALNHPAGSIGKKMTLKVEDIMLQKEDLPLCRPHDKLVDKLVDLSNKKCGALLVVGEDKELLGIFTDGDLRRSLQLHGARTLEEPLERLMTSSAISVSSGMLVWDAMKSMQQDPKKWVMVTPVLDQGKVVGILRMHDIIQAGIG